MLPPIVREKTRLCLLDMGKSGYVKRFHFQRYNIARSNHPWKRGVGHNLEWNFIYWNMDLTIATSMYRVVGVHKSRQFLLTISLHLAKAQSEANYKICVCIFTYVEKIGWQKVILKKTIPN